MRLLHFCCLIALYVPFLAEGTESVDEIIASYMQQNAIPGVAIAIFDGKEGITRSFGVSNLQDKNTITPDTIFEIASITKVFTTTELALQIMRGTMQLNQKAVDFLPELRDGKQPISQVTLLQLATHTSCLPRIPPYLANDEMYDYASLINFLKIWHPRDAIGSHYRYSNLGYGVIGIDLEYLTKKSYQQLLNDDICLPLDMHSTMMDVPDNLLKNYAQGYLGSGDPAPRWGDNIWPAGGALRSTSGDMLKFLEANLNIRGPKELLHAMQITQRGYFYVNDKLTLGLGWQRAWLQGRLIIDKNGGVTGFSSYIGMIPAQKLGIVILANKARINSTLLGRSILITLSDAIKR